MIPARIKAEYPGWSAEHVLAGWTAVRLADPRYQLTAQSAPELADRLRQPGWPSRWKVDQHSRTPPPGQAPRAGG
jgi:hypothetical protein